MDEEIELLKLVDLEDMLKIDRRTVYRMINENEFPRPIKLRDMKKNPNTPNFWFKDEVLEWLMKKKKDKRSFSPRWHNGKSDLSKNPKKFP